MDAIGAGDLPTVAATFAPVDSAQLEAADTAIERVTSAGSAIVKRLGGVMAFRNAPVAKASRSLKEMAFQQCWPPGARCEDATAPAQNHPIVRCLMGKRAEPSGIILTAEDAAVVKGMLVRGDRQHDIAAWFGVNGGRIAEIATGYRFPLVSPMEAEDLPPPGPYPAGRVAVKAIAALSAAKAALASVEAMIRHHRI